MKKKILLSLVILIIIVIGYGVFSENGFNPSARYDRQQGDVYVYETSVDSADECTSYETFDPEQSTCVFECESETECAEISDSIDAEIDGWLTDDTDTPIHEQTITSEDNALVTEYAVERGENITLMSGEPGQSDDQIWNDIARLSPDTLSDRYIESFQVFDSSDDDTIAFVDDEDQNGKWRVGVNTAQYEQSTIKEKTLTVVHELAHIVTLNNRQVVENETCSTFAIEEGCTKPNSYLNMFVSKFWNSDDIEKTNNDENVYERDRFVTEYSATNPPEDIAESFAYFVVNRDRVSGTTIKDNKINFFATYPELVTMKSEIRAGMTANIVRARKL